MKFKKVTAMISLILCLAIPTNLTAFAVKSQPDSAVESISIFPLYGVLEGQSRQMSATVEANGSFFNSVEWSSSNPNAISCTEDGIIKGLIAGESATITCKAKWGSVKDTIKVYCAEKIPSPVKCTPNSLLTIIYAQPDTGIWSGTILSLPSFLEMILYVLRLAIAAPSSADAVVFSSKLTVCGRIKNYAYVKYGESEIFDGFIKYSNLPIKIKGFFDLSAENMDVWANDITYADRKLTTTYDGDVKWDINNEDYILFDETTGQITGLKAGVGNKVTITAKADGMTDTCTIHLLYKWPQAWTGEINQNTYLLLSDGDDYTLSEVKLPKGQSFIVYGDCGTSSGQAYGMATVGGVDYWGYVPIHYLSTKGTISQYNNMKTTLNYEKVPIAWPMYDKTINNISSPYGPRNITASGSIHHRGYDITTGTPGEIAGEYVVASFSGTVKKVYNNTTDCGYSISISSDCVDPVTGKKISIIYMHLLEKPKYEDGKSISVGDYIQVGTIIGKVGNSNGGTDPDMGYHLHFEANSQNAAVGDSGRSDFTYTLNPMFFFINKNVTFSETKSYNKYGGYWYDLNGGYQNEEIFKSYFNF